MIIDSGFDVLQLSLLVLRQERSIRPALLLLKFTAELDLVEVETLVDEMADAQVTSFSSQILEHIDDKYTKYFATAVGVARPLDPPHRWDWHHDDDHGLELEDSQSFVDAVTSSGRKYLGHLTVDPEGSRNSGPMYRYHSYPGYEDLPRALIVPGPHPMFNCPCAACRPHQSIISAVPSSYEDDSDS